MILTFIFMLLFFIIFIILFAISISCKYIISINYDNYFKLKIHIRTLFFNWEILNKDKKNDKKDSNEYNYKKVEKKIDKNNKEKSSFKFLFKLITKENISHIFKFLFSLYKKIRTDKVDLHILINLDDPYYNGILLSTYYSIKGVYPNLPIKININWQKEVNKAQGKIKGSFRPISLLYMIVIFVFSPRSLKILWQYYRFKKQ